MPRRLEVISKGQFEWVLWLLLMGQGGTLHRAARRFRWNIGKRFTHHLATAPHDLTALEASMWAEIVRLGGDRVDFERIRSSRALLEETRAMHHCVAAYSYRCAQSTVIMTEGVYA